MGSYQQSALLPSRMSQRRFPGRSWLQDVPSGPASRRRSPSPGLPRRYDSYIPPRPVTPHREEYPNVYRPNSWLPPRSPSPDRYVPPPVYDSDHWDRPSAWPAFSSSSRSGRRSPNSPVTPPKDRSRRDTMATPMFEPSDTWKQLHVDETRPIRNEFLSVSPIADRYPDRRIRRSVERSPDGISIRGSHYSPKSGGDRYRPNELGHNAREPFRPARVADCYRPNYDTDRTNMRTRDRDSSTERSRRDSTSGGTAPERSPRGSGSKWSNRASRSPSPLRPTRSSHVHSPTRASNREAAVRTAHNPRSDHDMIIVNHNVEPSTPRLRKHIPDKPPSRPQSRSSIASSRPSDRYSRPPSPGVPAIPDSTPAAADPMSSAPLQGTPEGQLARLDVQKDVFSQSHPSESPRRDVSILPPTEPNKIGSDWDVTHLDIPILPDPATTEKFDTPPRRSKSVAPMEVNPSGQTSIVASGQGRISASPPLRPYQLEPMDISQDTHHVDGDAPSADGTLSIPEGILHRIDDDSTSVAYPLEEEPVKFSSVQSPKPKDQEIRSNVDDDVPSVQQESSTMDADEILSSIGSDHVAEEIKDSPSLPIPDPDSNVQSQSTVDDQRKHTITFTLRDVPSITDAKTLDDALRVIVMTRSLCDTQTRPERVEPVLLANRTLAAHHSDKPATVFEERTDRNSFYNPPAPGSASSTSGPSAPWRKSSVREALVARFSARETTLEAKKRRLCEEYMALHEKWLAHCARLDSVAKVSPSEDTAAANAGRSTRRSINLGDAVRSDLEMEQVIASLGNDDLTDPNHLALRNLAKIPDMISVVHGDVGYVFDDTNHLVSNPAEFYGPDTGIHDWTEEEKKIFLDKYAAYPKQFGIIAEFLPAKTVSQCIDYYYLHKKAAIDFRKAVLQLAPNKRRRGARRGKQKGNGLLADIRQHDDEMHRDPGLSTNGPITRRKRVQMEGTPATTPTPEPDMRHKRRRTNNSARSTAAGEAEEESAHPQDQEPRPARRGRKPRKPKQVPNLLPPEDANTGGKPTEQHEASSRRKSAPANLQWSDEDKSVFLSLLSQYGDDFKRIAASMPNKTTIQVSNYYRTNLIDLDLEKVAAGAPKRSPTPEPAPETWKESLSYSSSGVMIPMAGAPSSSSVGQHSYQGHLHDPHLQPSDLREAIWGLPYPGPNSQPSAVANDFHQTSHALESSQSDLRLHSGPFPLTEHPLIDDTACQPSDPAYNCPAPTANGLPEPTGEFSPRIRVYPYSHVSTIPIVAEQKPRLLSDYAAFTGTP